MKKNSNLGFFGILLLIGLLRTQSDKINVKENTKLSLIGPFTSKELLNNWIYSEQEVIISPSEIILNSGKADSSSFLALLNPLDRDDYLQIQLKLKVGDLMTEEGKTIMDDHKVNGFFIQFSQKSISLVSDFQNSDILTFHGLVIMFISHHEENDHGYHTTYRYFDRETEVKRSYIDILFDELVEGKRNDRGCVSHPVDNYLEWQIDLDFEKSKSLKLSLKKSLLGDFEECFKIDHIASYINHNANYLSMFTSMGSQYTFELGLTELRFVEKKHRLDVDESLLVSHELAVEIFDKLKTFSKTVNQDKETLMSIHNSYQEVSQKTSLLEVFMRDLFRGTRKFEEHVIESLTRFRVFNPENLPKMMRIKQHLETLQFKQDKVFQRFVSIKGLIAAKKVFHKTRKMLKRIEKGVSKLTEQISSEEFTGFFGKVDGFVDLMKRMDLVEVIEDVILSD